MKSDMGYAMSCNRMVRNCHSTVNQPLYLVADKGWVLTGRALCSWVAHGQNNAPRGAPILREAWGILSGNRISHIAHFVNSKCPV